MHLPFNFFVKNVFILYADYDASVIFVVILLNRFAITICLIERENRKVHARLFRSLISGDFENFRISDFKYYNFYLKTYFIQWKSFSLYFTFVFLSYLENRFIDHLKNYFIMKIFSIQLVHHLIRKSIQNKTTYWI